MRTRCLVPTTRSRSSMPTCAISSDKAESDNGEACSKTEETTSQRESHIASVSTAAFSASSALMLPTPMCATASFWCAMHCPSSRNISGSSPESEAKNRAKSSLSLCIAGPHEVRIHSVSPCSSSTCRMSSKRGKSTPWNTRSQSPGENISPYVCSTSKRESRARERMSSRGSTEMRLRPVRTGNHRRTCGSDSVNWYWPPPLCSLASAAPLRSATASSAACRARPLIVILVHVLMRSTASTEIAVNLSLLAKVVRQLMQST
mmetsp:Transcript_70482/g.106592  ORF Transcript_70482/g.106592 Transcript_70482/m.106592 type:complete len:262 (-) Transcript_70482:55-840(-)